MPDVHTPDRGLSTAEALSRLPLETPDRSAWPLLERRIVAAQPASRPRPRWPFALAAAAALAVAALMPRLLSPPVVAPAGTTLATATAPARGELEALMTESAQLENFISAVSADEMATASAAALGLEFEDRLRRLDVALSAPTLDSATRTQLWQQRVSLLREYAGVQGTSQWLAADGGNLDGALVATF
jgi:hypothetical protein